MATAARHLTCAETAKLVRAALKAAFPGVRFSVRSDNYAGGASIDVRWTDGPGLRAVEAVAKLYQGSTFDGTRDLKSDHDSLLAGPDGTVELVHYGADFVQCQWSLSADYRARLAAKVTELTGEAFDPARRYRFGYKDSVIDEYGSAALWQMANLDGGAA